MDKIDKLTKDDLFMSELEAREWDKWEEKSMLTYAKKLGKEEGLAQGEIKGREENTKELILSMLDNNATLEFISKVTKN